MARESPRPIVPLGEGLDAIGGGLVKLGVAAMGVDENIRVDGDHPEWP